MKPSLKRIALYILASVLAVAFSASCRTVGGFGKDVQAAGGHINSASH